MKGIILYEDYRGKEVVEAIKLGEVDYKCHTGSLDDVWINELSGIRMSSTQACCNKSDTYDFETGALIALIKMCSGDAVEKAFYEVYKNEIEKDEAEISAKENDYEEKIRALEEENEKLKLDCEKLQHGYIDTDKCSKPLTKREEMWDKILGDYKYGGSLSVKVEKAFINDFLSEAEDNGLVWANGEKKPTEFNKWEDWRAYIYIVFTIWNYSPYKELTWGIVSDENTIDYLPPMRWDLFKKGRLIVCVTADNVDDFIKECEKNCKIKLPEAYIEHNKNRMDHNHGFIEGFKDYWNNEGKLPHGKPSITYGPINFMTPDSLIRKQKEYPKIYNAKKIVDWEDVR